MKVKQALKKLRTNRLVEPKAGERSRRRTHTGSAEHGGGTKNKEIVWQIDCRQIDIR